MGILFEPAHFPHFDYEKFAQEEKRYRSAEQKNFDKKDDTDIAKLAREHLDANPHILGEYDKKRYAVAYCGKFFVCLHGGGIC